MLVEMARIGNASVQRVVGISDDPKMGESSGQ